jgi:branched-chain amino acid transport system ATP-binding protein
LATDLLHLDAIHAHYGESHVLHGISFGLQKGHVLALLGRNGAGKTTTLLTLSGLLPCTGGQIYLDGQAIGSMVPEAIAKRGIRIGTARTACIREFERGRKPHGCSAKT